MKAATGELNLTVITVIAIAAIMGFFSITLWPKIRETINAQWNSIDDHKNIAETEQGQKSQS